MFNISDIIQFKQALTEKHGVDLHYHDVCPKPFFTMVRTDSEIQAFITAYLQPKGYAPQFSDDGLQFTLTRRG